MIIIASAFIILSIVMTIITIKRDKLYLTDEDIEDDIPKFET